MVILSALRSAAGQARRRLPHLSENAVIGVEGPPLSSFRLALGSPTLANSGPAPAGSLKDDSGRRGHLTARLKGVSMILVLSRQHRQEYLCHKIQRP